MPPTPVAALEIIRRVRTKLVEFNVLDPTEEDFWDSDDILGWYDDGVANQHLRIMENKGKRPDIDPYSHDYLRYFLDEAAGLTLTANVQDYDQPETSVELLSIVIQQASDVEVECQRVPFAHDWRIKNLPQFKPIQGRPYWTVTSGGMIRFYFSTPKTLPSAELPYIVRFFRDVLRTPSQGDDVDLPDSWNTGPVNYAIGCGLEQQQTDPTFYFQQAMMDAESILPAPPPQPTR